MVHLMGSGHNVRPDPERAAIRGKFPTKLKIEDSLEEEHGPLNKRSKISPQFNEWRTGYNEFPISPSQYNPLDEPSPLGLSLRKSPSLLDLLQMRLSQGNASSVASALCGNLDSINKKDSKGTTASATHDKLKASNFPALCLRIGQWEYVSRYEGDLVAKFYYAKHKLVWEVLDGGLKSKIEIQWSDIAALKANFLDDAPGTLTIMLARPPLFFKETNPQPRKHTLWLATADFTDGQASMHRQHFLQCRQGLLNKHYDKLIQCDMRLNLVSQQPVMVLDSPYFEVKGSVLEYPIESKALEVGQLESAQSSAISSFKDVESPSIAQSCSLTSEEQNSAGFMSEHSSPLAPSPSSVIYVPATERNGSHRGNSFQAQQLMSMSDVVNHIGHHISERMASANSTRRKEALDSKNILENIAQTLLSDTQFTTVTDEKKLMSRVNSLCCLLEDSASAPCEQKESENQFQGLDVGIDSNDSPGCKQDMSRKDSFGDLLLNLPRVTSLQKFLFDISEDNENQAR